MRYTEDELSAVIKKTFPISAYVASGASGFDAMKWCLTEFGDNMFAINPRKGKYGRRRCKPRWDFAGNEFFFSKEEDALYFKLVWGQ
jgi:hypothetical protein